MQVNYTRKGDVHTIETGGAIKQIIIDNTDLPESEKSGTAKQLLASSAVMCYMSALIGALEARGAQCEDIKASAELELGGNALGQGRVRKIRIHAGVTIRKEDEAVFSRVERIMKQGCLVTGSLHDGIEMEYDLQHTIKG